MRAINCIIATSLGLIAQGGDANALERALARFRTGEAGGYEAIVTCGESAIPALVKILEDRAEKTVTRFLSANALGDLGEAPAFEPLVRALRDPEFNVRRCAALALAKINDPRARKPLEELAENDPFVYKDPQTGRAAYLVREDAKKALFMLSRGETFLADASMLPPLAAKAPFQHLPWPFQGGFRGQNVFNNYQQPTDAYVHGGLDLLQPAGTEVRAVEGGVVALIHTNYPDWKTHHFFIVVPDGKSGEGWCYTHMDPDRYKFKVGDRVARGQALGTLADFKVGANDGADHLHLDYVKFARGDGGRVETARLFDPLQCFDYEDKIPPVVEPKLRFVKKNTLEEFQDGAAGIVSVRGKADIIAGISDAAFPGQACNWGVAVVTVEIRGAGAAPWRKLVIDQRGALGEERAAPVLFLSFEESKRFPPSSGAPGVVHYYRVTRTDGDGILQSEDARYCWHTAQKDSAGAPRFPNGVYDITVRAWDLAGNMGARFAKARVVNPD